MAADVFQARFTQIHNALFRDRRLSFKAKGVFGLISTHRDGFGVGREAIASFSTDGVSAVSSALRELVALGYLQRDRVRNAAGQLGDAVYFITDMPDGLVLSFDSGWDPEDRQGGAEQNRRSGPGCENLAQATESDVGRSEPRCGFPAQGNPAEGNRSHKKTTTSKKTTGKNTEAAVPRSGWDVRRTSTSGSSARAGEGGFAASEGLSATPGAGGARDSGPEQRNGPEGQRQGGRARHTAAELATVRAVRRFYPQELAQALPELPRVSEAILAAMRTDGRSVEQLGERIAYRWVHHGFAAKYAAGELRKPVGVAIALVRPLRRGDRFACADARCESGRDVMTGEECRLCAVRLADWKSERRAGGGRQSAPGRGSASGRRARDDGFSGSGRLQDCAEPSCRQPILRGGGRLCPGCEQDAREAEEAAQALLAGWGVADGGRRPGGVAGGGL
ncbi:hypothetical protein ACWCWD_29440 [Streptomyces sp. NPDC001493]